MADSGKTLQNEITTDSGKIFARSGKKGVLTWFAFFVACLFAFPILSVTAAALTATSDVWDHLVQTVLSDYIINTLFLASGVACLVAIIGGGTAWLVTMCRFPGRALFEWALILPLAVPAYVMAYTYTDFLQASGPLQVLLREVLSLQYGEYWFPDLRSMGGAITMLSLVLYPYVYMLARAAFLEQSVCALEVSRTLGCSPLSSFFRVALPLARPAIIAGTSLALMETLADFGTVSFFGIQTFTTGIMNAWTTFGDLAAARQLSTYLLVFIFSVFIIEKLSRGKARYHHATNRYQNLPGYKLQGLKKCFAVAACGIPLFLGFVLPAIILISKTLSLGDKQFGIKFITLAFNSFTLATVTACAAVLIAVLLAYTNRMQANFFSRAATKIASMGYAIPGTVVAIGTLFPLAALDNTIDSWMRSTFDISTGLILTGTITALVFAYLVRFLAVSLNTVESGLGKIRPSMDDASRTLGMGPIKTLWHVHTPIMSGSLITAGLVVFVDVMKELPATLVMRPFNFDTLAVHAYNLASDERLSEASTASLTIVAVGILPLIFLSRAIAKSRAGSQTKPAQDL
ncbi:iron ABC transporter permease [Kiloniella laminariae]|uniref:Iron ABC transporter permease n=1 Tax=Kiloniella laminariae TaxID=454162 RepID=A0ABT4LHH3_9PROT|nr:iron ABC transporter permease [Kiloniella laminariae]MCZ4280541.1 iron ABC transporter permease [Kiloniella laminariae]